MRLVGLMFLVTSLASAGCALSATEGTESDTRDEGVASTNTPLELGAPHLLAAPIHPSNAGNVVAAKTLGAECSSCPRPPPVPWHTANGVNGPIQPVDPSAPTTSDTQTTQAQAAQAP